MIDLTGVHSQARRLRLPLAHEDGPMGKTGHQSSWDRFQTMLEALQPGDEIHVAAAARDTGLPLQTCEQVLEALTRVDLFTRLGDHAFVRRRLFQMIEQLES